MQVVLGQLLTSSSALFGVEHLESLPAFDAIESAAKTSRSGADASRAQALSRFEPKRVGWFTQESYRVLHLGTMRGTVPERSLLTMQAHTPAGPLRTLAPVVFSDSELSQASIRFEGALDALTGPAARPVIDALVAKNPTKVTVDLGLVPYSTAPASAPSCRSSRESGRRAAR